MTFHILSAVTSLFSNRKANSESETGHSVTVVESKVVDRTEPRPVSPVDSGKSKSRMNKAARREAVLRAMEGNNL